MGSSEPASSSQHRSRILFVERLESRVVPGFLAPLAFDAGVGPVSVAVGVRLGVFVRVRVVVGVAVLTGAEVFVAVGVDVGVAVRVAGHGSASDDVPLALINQLPAIPSESIVPRVLLLARLLMSGAPFGPPVSTYDRTCDADERSSAPG